MSREAFRIALQALAANRLRSVLTTLGVLIGVMSVVLLVAIGQGARVEITGAIEGLGSNLLFVLPGDGDFTAGPARSRFTTGDVEALEREFPTGGAKAAGYIVGADNIRADGERVSVTVFAVTGSYLDVLDRDVARGQAITNADVDATRRLALLGSSAAEQLFGNQDPIGRNLDVGSTRFRVAGVLSQVGGGSSPLGPDQDRVVVVPVTTGQRLFGTSRLDAIFVRSASAASVDTDRATIERVLSRRLSEGDFSVISQDEILGVVSQILQTLTLVLAAIAGISLLVGGVGVSNIMLVSVSERTREIGLRKALGARTRDITSQFLVEAMALTAIGGFIGLVLGVALALIAETFLPVPAIITWWSIALALATSIIVGIVFGVLPARRAGQLDPVQALRHE